MITEFTKEEHLEMGKMFGPTLATATEEQRLEGLSYEARLRGMPFYERVKGLPPQERLKGLPPEERIQDLSPEELKKLRNYLDQIIGPDDPR